MTVRFDKLGVVIAAIVAYAAFAAPFATFRANRIVPGEARSTLDSLPAAVGPLLLAILVIAAIIALLKTPLVLRLAASVIALAALAILIGVAGSFLTPEGNTFARISPASGFWLLIFAFTLLLADVLTRLNLSPWARLGVLVIAALAIGLLLASGSWNSLSILKEYANRADSFWAEGSKHVTLALGSLAAAVVVGLPIGILCHRVDKFRAGVLNVLNIIQTIPSIALFGLLIAPLGWVATHVPGAAALGIRGIGTAPAFVALFLYSLLPVVANTVVGLAGVPRAANDAARGVGMTDRQRLFGVEFPLAFAVILTGIRIVLVQNIGLATIAALIGGGGFGVFVFQGVGQTAMDLVLLGAVPTVAMAFAAAIILDAVIEMTSTKRREAQPA
ncbi:MAG: ABC transporter permease [Mesorhizobium sp.]|uniref:ABC transporter permease n=1 Tax=unclassified Mesorhizobium TaxID=325217 RepID=UPI000FCAFCA4|nr:MULTISPECIES: ABC transporter permease [unclassified Mesorhizobium]RUV66532.1 ABC transporter permease [Mesorhizobium sp. M5C.F.Cr.IN.023.01.1.1]RWF87523.1 MAG: ABC transporter permease [Mesorhizobium sp.]RWF94002.1 MAG: ABC transporter permease [Mesorhizobium sp.]RWI40273.1 MAG: ABC transporter permease [Mesorhizobium sp.]RWI45968.1 MAG: ABC transporter permease [Mesorhizobium sp.]